MASEGGGGGGAEEEEERRKDRSGEEKLLWISDGDDAESLQQLVCRRGVGVRVHERVWSHSHTHQLFLLCSFFSVKSFFVVCQDFQNKSSNFRS